jgi:hypothetical protein
VHTSQETTRKRRFLKKENKETTALLGVPVFALLYSETTQSSNLGPGWNAG